MEQVEGKGRGVLVEKAHRYTAGTHPRRNEGADICLGGWLRV